MSAARAVLREAKTWWLQRFAANRVQATLPSPLISITFDDVPLSAYQNGLPLLNELGIKGTFYVCMGIDPPGTHAHLGPEEVRRLRAEGHEIGCHTFSHYRLSQGSAAAMADDTAQNRAALGALLGPGELRSFSFPFGDLSFDAKKKLAPHYGSLRSTRHGINADSTDLNCLKAVPMYEGRMTPDSMDAWLDEAAARRGWLILYTHGVTDSPGPFDISTGTFREILTRCKARGWPILPVGDAFRLLSGSRPT